MVKNIETDKRGWGVVEGEHKRKNLRIRAGFNERQSLYCSCGVAEGGPKRGQAGLGEYVSLTACLV